MRSQTVTLSAQNAKASTRPEQTQKKCLQKQSESKDAKYHTQSQYIKSDKERYRLTINPALETFFLIPL